MRAHKGIGSAVRVAVLVLLVASSARGGNPVGCPAGNVVFVNVAATGANSGGSWADAFTSLMDAIACADSGDQIWVARGTYRTVPPLPAAQDRTRTFRMETGVGIYGGFVGTETALSQRNDQSAFGGGPDQTILDGNIGDPGMTIDNTVNVVTADGVSATAVIDAFVIRNGSTAQFGMGSLAGAGLFAPNGGSPTVRNSVFTQNTSDSMGGGLATIGGSPNLYFVVFRGGRSGLGGGMSATSGSAPVLDIVFFESNRSRAAGGGGLYLANSTATLRDCQFAGNVAEDDMVAGGVGGALYAGASTVLCVGCYFLNNRAFRGGGAIVSDGSTTRVVGSRLFGNSVDASGNGGAILVRNGGDVTVVNSALGNNVLPGTFGRAIALEGSNALVENSTISGDVHLVSGILVARNSIFWDGGIVRNGNIVDIRTSDVEGGCPSGASCTAVVDLDPQFTNPPGGDTVPGTQDDDFSLPDTSPLVNLGDNGLLPPDSFDADRDGNTSEILPIDIDGRPRISATTVDIGAYEIFGDLIFDSGFED